MLHYIHMENMGKQVTRPAGEYHPGDTSREKNSHEQCPNCGSALSLENKQLSSDSKSSYVICPNCQYKYTTDVYPERKFNKGK